MANDNEKLAYTIAQACAVTGLSDATLYRRHSAGQLIMRKVGRRTLILHDDLMRMLRELPSIENQSA